MRKNYQKYIEVKNKTYLTFEVYHRKAISTFFKSDLNYRDLNIIKLYNQNADLSLNEVIETVGISYSNLSNRLSILEKGKYIQRSKEENDSRKIKVTLLPNAIELISKYQTYVKNLTEYLRSNLSIADLNNLLNFLVLANNKLNAVKISKLNLLKNTKKVLQIFDDIQNKLIGDELELIESDKLSLTYNQIWLLTELYLNQLFANLTLPTLADALLMPYQTLNSKIKNLISLELLAKNTDKRINGAFIFPDKVIHLIDNFVNSRLISTLEIFCESTEKELTAVYKGFELLKAYSLNILTINQ